MNSFLIRKATIDDLPILTTIYNQAIESGQTADTIPYQTSDRREWFEGHWHPNYPLFVIETNKIVMGYATLSKYREGRPAVRLTVEISYYIHNAHQRKELGSALLKYSIETAKKIGFKHSLALLLDTNLPSVRLLEKFGFMQWGHFPNIAEIDGKPCGQYVYGRHL